MTDANQQPIEFEQPVTDRMVWRRDEQVAVVEIDCAVMAQAIEGGNVVSQGVHRYRVPRSALPVLTSNTYVRSDEDREYYKRATETYERELQHRIDDDHAVRKFREKGEADEERARIKEIKALNGSSPEAVLQRDYRRGLPPFERVTVVFDRLTNPADEARIADQNELIERERVAREKEAASAAGAVAAAVNAALQPVVTLILEQMKQQQNASKKGNGQ